MEDQPHIKADLDKLTLGHVNFFPLDPTLASRYNSALQTVFNITNTTTDFMVDIRGVSPELKKQFGSYLTIEDITPYTVILSPDQEHAPIIDPRFSFDKEFMHKVYSEAGCIIHTVTPNEILWGELNNSIDVLTNVEDLLRLTKVSLVLDTPLNTLKNVKKLNEMHDSLMQYLPDNYKVNEMIEMHKKLKLLKYGDMRGIDLNGTFPITMDVGSYYTKLFGGTCIIRDKSEVYLIHSLGSSKRTFNVPKEVIPIRIDNPELIDVFYQEGFIKYDLRKERISEAVREIEDAVLLSKEHDFYPSGLSQERDEGRYELERSKGLVKCASSFPAAWYELRELERSATGRRRTAELLDSVLSSSIDAKVKLAMPVKHEDVINHVLNRIDNHNVNFNNRAALDADGLMKEFETYSVAKKKYVCYQLNGGE